MSNNPPNPTKPPPPELAENLQQAAAIKRAMTALLRELETKVTGQPVAKPGAWRHHPKDWADNYPGKNYPGKNPT